MCGMGGRESNGNLSWASAPAISRVTRSPLPPPVTYDALSLSLSLSPFLEFLSPPHRLFFGCFLACFFSLEFPLSRSSNILSRLTLPFFPYHSLSLSLSVFPPAPSLSLSPSPSLSLSLPLSPSLSLTLSLTLSRILLLSYSLALSLTHIFTAGAPPLPPPHSLILVPPCPTRARRTRSGSASARNCAFANKAGAGVVVHPGMLAALAACRVHGCGPGGGVRFEAQARGDVRFCDSA